MTRNPHNAALADILPLIESLELPYLESLQQLLADHIAERREALITDARRKIIQIALSVGMDPEELAAMKPQRQSPACAGEPRYRDPESGKTWSGMGRIPAWIKGKSYDDFLIRRH